MTPHARRHRRQQTLLPAHPPFPPPRHRAAARRKVDDTPVDENLRAAIRGLCNSFAIACNKYYAFGSVFAEEL